MDRLTKRLREDAARIDAEIPVELDDRIRASLMSVEPRGAKPERRETRSPLFWWASSLTGVAAAIAVIAVNAQMTQSAAKRLAIMAQDGLSAAIRPAHGPTDGDVVFVLANGDKSCADPLTLTRIGALASDCLARACARAVYEAERGETGAL